MVLIEGCIFFYQHFILNIKLNSLSVSRLSAAGGRDLVKKPTGPTDQGLGLEKSSLFACQFGGGLRLRRLFFDVTASCGFSHND